MLNHTPYLAHVFILHGVTCRGFHRDCLLSQSVHSALFINTLTQEVLFIRQSDRDQLGVSTWLPKEVNVSNLRGCMRV